MRACRSSALVLALSFVSGATWAESIPVHGAYDKRIKEVVFNPSDVVRVVGHYGYSTDIEFAVGEEVQNIALGDTLAWDVAPAANHLFVKPREDNAATNMTVMTNKRVYQLSLDARGHVNGSANNNAMFFLVRYRYPQDDAAARDAELRARTEAARATQMESSLKRLADARNWNFYACGDRKLWPAEVFDDGRFTYLRFPAAQNIPAVFEIGADGSESIVDAAMEGDFYVVHHTAEKFVLRQGKAVACLDNRSFNRFGVPTPTGTRSDEVVRTLLVPAKDGDVSTAQPLPAPHPVVIPAPAPPQVEAAPSVPARLRATRKTGSTQP
jgi:type IV secretion system protein VirB9